ncbi:hypothetical protein Avbf_08372, partial [Armadillidium vulgare]
NSLLNYEQVAKKFNLVQAKKKISSKYKDNWSSTPKVARDAILFLHHQRKEDYFHLLAQKVQIKQRKNADFKRKKSRSRERESQSY